jgi:two-component system OmpR family sensor kinase
MLERFSLRARLLAGVVVLAAVGLVAADIATYASLHSFLVSRLDRTVSASAHALARSTAFRGAPDQGELDQLASSTPNSYVGLVAPNGSIRWEFVGRPGEDKPPPQPRLAQQPATGRDYDETIETGAVAGSTRYRIRIEPLPGPSGYSLAVAAPLTDVRGTLHRLVLVELLVTLAVLAAVALVGLWVVRRALRPLDAIARTAGAIAEGDLSRRVERAEPRTEVGRLGLALNAMLGRIEESDRRLRRFVADASHELRTPLAAVRAYAELFARGAEQRPDDLARSMSGISRESERMSALVDDLLLLARLDEGRPLEQEPVRLDEVAAEAVDAAHAVEPGRPVDLDAAAATVVGDRDRLRQVIDNLLANARAHTPAGTPVHVRVATRNGDAVLAVADEGPGLEADDAEHVFERFYRADESRARANGGVGLGLSIVAAVAEAHGGKASVESKQGEGATFVLTLPLASGD